MSLEKDKRRTVAMLKADEERRQDKSKTVKNRSAVVRVLTISHTIAHSLNGKHYYNIFFAIFMIYVTKYDLQRRIV